MCELNIIRERRGSFLRLGRRFGSIHSKQKSKPCGRHGMTDAMIEGGRVMDYSSRILNLRLDTRAEVAPMKFGHADARHAAAEIARQAEAKIEELEAKLAKAVRERDEALNQLDSSLQGSRTESKER